MNSDIVLTATEGSFPRYGTEAYKLLELLSSGEPVSINECLLPLFGETLRSPLQTLRGAPYFWRIDRVTNEDGEKCLQLDQSHLSHDSLLDCKARHKRELTLRTLSRDLARSEARRLPIAERKLCKAKEKGSEHL
ncbi:hypothetical protein BCT73_15480 [Vibrio breoganii]|nr:hypothetical protein BCU80_03210 [Vibrio breoganii]PMK34084.1 hypothetical protein BCU06_00375 [Vibrio breoganii]PML54571.1 hypothetical protein BCT73_15480 [Vibrio breoganii]PMO81353.1 hypothetical protein BCT00_11690 [Vibrio breoganii]